MSEVFTACNPSAVRTGVDELKPKLEEFKTYVDEFARRRVTGYERGRVR